MNPLTSTQALEFINQKVMIYENGKLIDFGRCIGVCIFIPSPDRMGDNICIQSFKHKSFSQSYELSRYDVRVYGK